MRIAWRAATVVAAVSWCAAVAQGEDIQTFNFNTGSGGWTSPVGQWLYTAEGSTEKSWKLPLSGTNPAANFLDSPCFTITSPTIDFELVSHRFTFGMSGTGTNQTYVPPAGQVQYSLDDGFTWHGIPLADWYPFVGPGGGGDIPPSLNPATLTPGTDTKLLADGYAFQGTSAGYGDKNPKFIRSGFELSALPVGREIEFRLLGDLGAASFPPAPLRPIWDVNQIQIKGVKEGPCLPEPGCLALAASAAATVSIAAWRGRFRRTRRRCRRPCSAPRKIPARAASG